jgi:hypothetical protein
LGDRRSIVDVSLGGRTRAELEVAVMFLSARVRHGSGRRPSGVEVAAPVETR